ncbi:glycosyltransferase family 4 protein [Lichenihabitans psoromatis]|uniref:glycosyltransferase family 4 protein n=1 Tax=Lichenihabitans psoromatis TaxID=2528642 RepID=UPI001FDEF042|nr:glycosyltransferase family 4 protein [Lichenihabitans psoromatis]
MDKHIADPMTVIIVLDWASVTGGQAKVAFDSAIGLKQAGHRPIIFAAVGPIAPALSAAGIDVICLGQADLIGHTSKAAAAVQGIWNGVAAKRLGELLATCPAGRTVVHVHGWAKALSPSIALPIARSGLPAIYTMHEYFILCPNGGFYNYQKHHACPLDPLSLACWSTHCDSRTYGRKLWRAARQVVMERIAHLPTVFSDYICISKFQLDVIGHRLPTDIPVHEISNPIDALDLGPKPPRPGADMMFIGRLSPEKGPFLFAEAARLAGIVPLFVGDGPAASELAARFPEARLLGWKGPDEVRQLMREARALVFPSLWYEGQPLTVLEAKSLGTPVIVSDGCAGREEIEDGVAGLWFKSGDAADLARALREMANDALVERLSQRAYELYWSNPPTLQRHIAAITSVYRARLAPASPRGQAA